MKNLTLVLAVAAISFSAAAQSDSSNKKMSLPDIHNVDDGKGQNHDLIVNPDRGTRKNSDPIADQQTPVKSPPDGFMIQDGKTMMIVNGQMERMKTEMSLSNGTRVTTDGYYITKDGEKFKLKEGQLLDMNGQIVPRK